MRRLLICFGILAIAMMVWQSVKAQEYGDFFPAMSAATPTATPTPTAYPTFVTVTPTPAPTPTCGAGNTYQTTNDSALTGGIAGNATATGSAWANATYGVCPIADVSCFANQVSWELETDLFGIGSSGTGTIELSYPSNGTIVTSASGTGLTNNPGVMGYPFILYGVAGGGSPVLNQPPQFPTALTALTQFIVDSNYTMTGSITGQNNDLLLDEWIQPTNAVGPFLPDPNQLEVAIFWYYNFTNPLVSVFVKQFNQPAVVNGTLEMIPWQEFVSQPGGGTLGTVWFMPAPSSTIAASTTYGMNSGEVRMDVLPFLKEAQTTCGSACSSLSSTFYAEGNEIGNEFGATTAPNFTTTFSKVELDECIQPTATPTATATPNGGNIDFPSNRGKGGLWGGIF